MKKIMKNMSTFIDLVYSIRRIDSKMSANAAKAVNVSLTLRNWLIGCYIAEYELRGMDRAKYGDFLVEKFAVELQKNEIPRTDARELR